jgi:hypothetical protein
MGYIQSVVETVLFGMMQMVVVAEEKNQGFR